MVRCIESDIGQNSENLADALNRTYTQDGKPILQTLHFEGQLKKVQTSLVVMTPQPNTRIKLDELNKILNEMKQGEDAVKRLAELDSSRGLQDPADVARRLRGDKMPSQINQQGLQATGDALGDNAIANNLRQQAAKMAAEAKGLLAESERLMNEATVMDPPAVEAPKAKRAYNKKAKVSA